MRVSAPGGWLKAPVEATSLANFFWLIILAAIYPAPIVTLTFGYMLLIQGKITPPKNPPAPAIV